jgi:Ca2+-binding RTX toxin-like protein
MSKSAVQEARASASRTLRVVVATIAAVAAALVAIPATADGAADPSMVAAAPDAASAEYLNVKFADGLAMDAVEASIEGELADVTLSIEPLFTLSTAELERLRVNDSLPDLTRWMRVRLAPGEDALQVAAAMRGLSGVESAEPAPSPPPPPQTTPDLSGNQGYLGPAPGGVDAQYSWTVPGGTGTGITIYDVEYEWNQNHEDLSAAAGVAQLVNAGDTPVGPFNSDNHGTAVLGEMVGDNNGRGVTGISYDANVGLAPANTQNLGYNPANAILLAVNDASPGDVILLEQQYWACGTGNYGPLEVLSSVYSATVTAVANGIIVVAAAGNGNVDLDAAGCGGLFDRSVRDSGAIIVGAGGPAGSSSDLAKLSFSTYGDRVDVQGWGSGVATTGYGNGYVDPDNSTNKNRFYTYSFSGTSSASPFVAAAAANIQAISLNRDGVPLSPLAVRQLLVNTGTPQQGNLSTNIGPRPNLKAAIQQQFPIGSTCNGLAVTVDIGAGDTPTNGADVILGTSGNDTIYALGGNDVVCAGDGDDTVIGAGGNDTIFGQGGNDTISGNAGNDSLYGNAGNDNLYSGSGNDTALGGIGNDVVGGSSGRDTIRGEAGDDTISGGGDDDFEVDGGSGTDAVNGGSGDDPVVNGGSGNDTVSGNGGTDIVRGGDGNDEVRGGPGDDQVFGESGNDFVAGNSGTDYCDGGSGTDTAASNCEVVVGIP